MTKPDMPSEPKPSRIKRQSRRAVLGGLAAALAVPSSPLLAATCRAQALGTSRVLRINTSGGLKIGHKTYPQTLDLAEGEVVLTFDDGPSGAPTLGVLDALRAECVQATFFMIGRNAAANPGLARRIVADGHSVAHHSFSHPWTFRQRSFEAGKADILRGFQAVDEAAYGVGSASPRLPFFRYPGFADTPELNAMLANMGVGIFGCDLWASDWTFMSPERQLSLMMRRLSRERRGILLFHDVQPQTAAMLPAFLRALREGGYRVAHLNQGPLRPALREARPGWRPETERIIAGRR
ncbi:MAG: polysaccharide deacetylase family protein [Bosea sp. (in: a-proteobacteria)]